MIKNSSTSLLDKKKKYMENKFKPFKRFSYK